MEVRGFLIQNSSFTRGQLSWESTCLTSTVPLVRAQYFAPQNPGYAFGHKPLTDITIIQVLNGYLISLAKRIWRKKEIVVKGCLRIIGGSWWNWQTRWIQVPVLRSIRVQIPYSPPIGMYKHNIPMLRIRVRTANLAHYGHQLSWLERTPDKRKVPGSIPGCPTNGMESEIHLGYTTQQIQC